jgi:hypothetical protein
MSLMAAIFLEKSMNAALSFVTDIGAPGVSPFWPQHHLDVPPLANIPASEAQQFRNGAAVLSAVSRPLPTFARACQRRRELEEN